MTVLEALNSQDWHTLALGDLHRLLIKAAAEMERHHIADRGFAGNPLASEAMDAACQAQQTAVDQLDAALQLLETPVDYGWMEKVA